MQPESLIDWVGTCSNISITPKVIFSWETSLGAGASWIALTFSLNRLQCLQVVINVHASYHNIIKVDTNMWDTLQNSFNSSLKNCKGECNSKTKMVMTIQTLVNVDSL